MKTHMLASDLFGPFYMDRLPRRPDRVPSLEEMRIAYGAHLPAYDAVGRYLPLNIRVKWGKGHEWADWPAVSVRGLAAVFGMEVEALAISGARTHMGECAASGPLARSAAMTVCWRRSTKILPSSHPRE